VDSRMRAGRGTIASAEVAKTRTGWWTKRSATIEMGTKTSSQFREGRSRTVTPGNVECWRASRIHDHRSPHRQEEGEGVRAALRAGGARALGRLHQARPGRGGPP